MVRSCLHGALCALLALPLFSQTTHTLSTGSGPGHMSVTVDGYGAFGACFPPVGELTFETAVAGPVPTTCGSAFILHEPAAGPPRPFTSYNVTGFPAGLPGPTLTLHVPGQDIEASWTFGNLNLRCRQTIHGPDPLGGTAEGSTLVQRYEVTNADTVPHVLDFTRWHDTDLGLVNQFMLNQAGATASVASLGIGATPPLMANGHVVFAYDTVFDFVVMNSLEVIDEAGRTVENDRWIAFDNTAGGAWITIGGSGANALTQTVNPDTNGDLLTDTPRDVALALAATAVNVSPASTVTILVKTRCSILDPSSPVPVWEQARNLSATVFNGTYLGAGVQPMLCINGQGSVATVPVNAPITVNLAPPFGLSSSGYVLFATAGSPSTGNPCGAPRTLDYAFWGAPYGSLGIAGFPAAAPFAFTSWTGGGGSFGLPLASNIPGIGLLQTPLSAGNLPCGNAILGPVALGQDVVVTVQAIVAEPGAPLGLSLSNVVSVAVGNCNAPTR